MPNLGQVIPPQEVIIRSGRSRPSDKEGGGHPHPKIKDEGRSQKNLFSAPWALVWSKYNGGGPSPASATDEGSVCRVPQQQAEGRVL